MGDIGILGVITPSEYGGNGLGNLARVIVLEEMGRVCPAIPMALQVHHMATHALNTFGNQEQKKKYLPPLPKAVRATLVQAFEAAAKDSKVISALAKLGLSVAYLSSEEVDKKIQQDYKLFLDTWEKIGLLRK